MDPISVTFSQAGRPFLTTRVRSVAFQDVSAARTQESVPSSRGLDTRTDRRPVDASTASASSLQRTDGFGQGAQRNLFLSAATTASSGAETEAPESADGLTDAEREQVEKLKARDAEVRRHEQAHAAVGGQYASAPSYTYQQGPDGRRYAIGGEVQIDVAPVAGDPEATIEKMGVVKAAALAPAEPSAADRRVAALADAQRLQAVAELASLRSEERLEVFEDSASAPETSGLDPVRSKPDTRLADAASLLGLSDASQPGQKLDTAA